MIEIGTINSGVVLLDFWATWCAPCKQYAPILEDVVSRTGVNMVKVNVQENQELTEKLLVKGIPTLVLLKDGEPKATLVGTKTADQVIEWLNETEL